MQEDKPILFFDGHCNLCNRLVSFVVSQDKDTKLLMAPLQGQTAQKKLSPHNPHALNSVVFLDLEGEIHLKSSALFLVAKELGGFFSLLLLWSWVPRFLTDWLYDQIASHRYAWFGTQEHCRLPSAEEQTHFLE